MSDSNNTSSNVINYSESNGQDSGLQGAYGDQPFTEDVTGKIFVGGLSWETTEQR